MVQFGEYKDVYVHFVGIRGTLTTQKKRNPTSQQRNSGALRVALKTLFGMLLSHVGVLEFESQLYS